MKKGLRIASIVLAVILVLMIVLPFAFRGKIEELVKTEGNKMLNAQFDFGSLSISLFKNFPKASVTLNDFWLKGVDEFENDTLLQAGRVTATVDVLSLFGDSGYDISKISLRDIWAKAIVLPDGKVNWDIMKESGEEKTVTDTEESSPFKIKLQRFTVDNLNVIYDDRKENMYAEARRFNAVCSGDLGSDRTTLNIEAQTKSFTYKMNGITMLNQVNLSADMDIDADLVTNKFTLEKNEFRLNAIKAGIDGWVALKDPAIELDLTLNTSEVGFKEILSLIPAVYSKEFSSLKTDGTVTLTASAKGIMQGDTLPAFDATMDIKNAMFRYPSLPAGVENINIHANVKNPGGSADLTQININPFRFQLAGNTFGVVADIATPVSDAAFKVKANGILDLGKIKDVYPLEDMQLNGVINADLSLAGRLSYVEKEQYEKVEASGNIKLTDMKLKMPDMPDIDIRQSLFTFTPKYLQLSETTVNIGQNDLTADCRFENYMGFLLHNSTIKGNLNIRSNYMNLNDFMSGEEVADTDTVAATGQIMIPTNIDFTMDANMKKVNFGTMSFSDIQGKLAVKDGKADMRNLSLKAMGGNIIMNGYYSSADADKPEFNAALKLSELSFSQTYKELDMVRKLAPVFENLKGTFSGNMNIRTLLDKEMSPVLTTMQGDGSLSTNDLNLSNVSIIDKIADAAQRPELKNIDVKDMQLDFTIKDGRLATQPFEIKWKDYQMDLSGTTGLDQTIDYTGKIKLPASAGSIAQLSTLNIKIGGTFSSPTVSLDAQSMAKQATETVKEKAVERLGEKLGLDSVAKSNTDSIKEKIKDEAVDKLKDLFKKKK